MAGVPLAVHRANRLRMSRRLWLLLPAVVLYSADIGFTLAGQPAAYWAGDYSQPAEHNPLAHALLARIGWSSSPEVGMVCADAFKPQLTEGAWAGDRFCIIIVGDGADGAVDVKKLPDLEGGLRWKDVTEEVDALLKHIWENNSGKWKAFSKS